jgi:hypothetical protein
MVHILKNVFGLGDTDLCPAMCLAQIFSSLNGRALSPNTHTRYCVVIIQRRFPINILFGYLLSEM